MLPYFSLARVDFDKSKVGAHLRGNATPPLENVIALHN
jgi:hypothetical protein